MFEGDRMIKRLVVISTHVVLLVGMLSTRAAAVDIPYALGLECAWGHSGGFGVGPLAAVGLNRDNSFEIVGDFLYFLPQTDTATNIETFLWEANANVVRTFYFGDEAIRPHLGFGLNVVSETQKAETAQTQSETTYKKTRAGINLLAGMRIGHGMHGLFFESRTVIGSEQAMVFTVGLRF
jgi:hypothetical protein